MKAIVCFIQSRQLFWAAATQPTKFRDFGVFEKIAKINNRKKKRKREIKYHII